MGFIRSLAFAGIFVFALTAKADDYTIAFTSLDGSLGSGSFSVAGTQVPGAVTTSYTPDSIGPLTIEGVDYSVPPSDATLLVNPDGSLAFDAYTVTVTPGGSCPGGNGGHPQLPCGTPEIFDGVDIVSGGYYYAYNHSQGGSLRAAVAFEGSYVVSDITPPPTVAATPEPGSVMLLGMGLLGVAGAVRRSGLAILRGAHNAPNGCTSPSPERAGSHSR